MANIVTVQDNKKVSVLVQPPGNVQVQISRTPIGTQIANYAAYAGQVTGHVQSNINQVGVLNGLTVSGNTQVDNLVVTGNLTVGNLIANSANYANFAGIAFSVDGANVNGYVANASHANIANVANSVTAANVSGLGNVALLNLDGSSSNVLYGNGVFSPLNASSNSIFNGNSNVSIPTADGNVYVNTNTNNQWTFADDGTFYLSNRPFIVGQPSYNVHLETGNGGAKVVLQDNNANAIILTNNETQQWTFDVGGNLVTPGPITQQNYNSPHLLAATGADTNWAYGFSSDESANFYTQATFYGVGSGTRGFKVVDNSNGNTWLFDDLGNTSVPNNIN